MVLCFLEPLEQISSQHFSNVQKSGLIKEMDKRYGPKKWFLMQDGVPAHIYRGDGNVLS